MHLPTTADTLDPADEAEAAARQAKTEKGTVDYEPDNEAVNRLDMAPGWAVFLASGTPPKPDDRPLYLSKAAAAWQKQTQSLTVRATLPIVANGNTIAVHVWFH